MSKNIYWRLHLASQPPNFILYPIGHSRRHQADDMKVKDTALKNAPRRGGRSMQYCGFKSNGSRFAQHEYNKMTKRKQICQQCAFKTPNAFTPKLWQS
jgi:hypothetical protein